MQVVLVEDRPSLQEALTHRLQRIGGATITWAPHFKFCSARSGDRQHLAVRSLLARSDLVLLDVFDRDQTQDHPTRSSFRCLDVLDVVAGIPPVDRPTVVVYSTAMSNPATHLALHTSGLAAAAYRPADLLDDLEAVVRGSYPNALPNPGPEAWKRVHPALRVGADLARLHRCMEQNPRAWRIVIDPQAPFDQAAQKWISRNVLPWLTDADHATYRIAVDITRAIAGLSLPDLER